MTQETDGGAEIRMASVHYDRELAASQQSAGVVPAMAAGACVLIALAAWVEGRAGAILFGFAGAALFCGIAVERRHRLTAAHKRDIADYQRAVEMAVSERKRQSEIRARLEKRFGP